MSNNESLDGREMSGVLQREQDRERRRMRDRQRRESMTTEEREKHLARRRRNYQLRRQKTGNAQSGSDGDQAFLAPKHEAQAMMDALGFGVGESSGCSKEFGLNLTDLDVGGAGHGGEKLSVFKRKLRVSQVRHLARTLDSDQRKLISAFMFSNNNPTSNSESGKKLRVTQVKRLARELNSSMKDVTSRLRQFKTRSSSDGQEITSSTSSEENSHCSSDIPSTAELDSNINHGGGY